MGEHRGKYIFSSIYSHSFIRYICTQIEISNV